MEDEQACKRARVSGVTLEQYAEDVADALVRFWQGDDASTLLGGLLDQQVVWHDSLLPERDVVGLDRLQALGELLRTAVPDLRLRVQRPLHTGQDGVVLGYWSATGTHSGALGPSLPPSGAQVSWEGSVLVRTSAAPQQEQQGQAAEAQPEAPPAVASATERAADSKEGGQEQSKARAPEKQALSAREGEGGAADAGLRGVEVWWSWDPVFLFRQMGWKQQAPEQAAGPAGADGENGVPEALFAQPGAASEGAQVDDLASQTAAAARAAFASEEHAAEAAAAAVEAVAAAASQLPALGEERLAAAQAANRAVVELYFHTYNTGHYRVLDHIVHPDYHYDGLLDLGGRRGREAMAAMMGGWRDCLPDLAIGHELFVAVGADKVTFRWVIRGSHATPGSTLLGVPAPPPGSPAPRLLVRGVTTLTLREGRIACKVSHANAAHTLAQLGAAAHPAIPL